MSRKRQGHRADDQAGQAGYRRPGPPAILVVSTQAPSVIAERVRIREELHDARAVTIKGKHRRPR